MRTRHITSQRVFLPPHASPGGQSAIFGTARILLVGMQRDESPPLIFGDQLLERMGIICTGQGEQDRTPEDEGRVHVLPPLQRTSRRDEAHPPRLVRGEILRCERGTFYEHCRGHIRPLHQLFAGPRGEILELQTAPASDTAPKPSAPEPAASSESSDGPAFRALFPEPGERRNVIWGDFKELLEPQLRHPERLRATHQLPCDAQVFEVLIPQTLEALSAAALGSAGGTHQLRPLTAQLAQKLGVPVPGRRVPASRPGLLGRGELFYRLQLVSDPTAGNQPSAGGMPGPLALLSAEAPLVTAAKEKTAIPERFLKPWEFHFTRDEVLYDMNVVAAFQSRLGATIRRLTRWPRWRSTLRKWQVLLSGKNFDEQLWAVRPPAGGLTHRAVRQWAERTLELAGYQPRTMLLEWEIFWRRKGLDPHASA